MQDIVLHDSILKRAAVFFQLSSSLSTLGFLDMVKCFPNMYKKYFVHCEADTLTAEMLLDALILPLNPSNEEARVIAMLCRFILIKVSHNIYYLIFSNFLTF